MSRSETQTTPTPTPATSMAIRCGPTKQAQARSEASRYMSVDDVAAYLGLTEKAVRHRVAQGTIPYRKLRGRLLFDKMTIDAWFASLPGVSKAEAERRAG